MPFPLLAILAGAALGAGTSAATGGKKKDLWKSALMGGLTGGVGGWLGGAGASAPLAAKTPAMSLLTGGVGNAASEELTKKVAEKTLMGKIGEGLTSKAIDKGTEALVMGALAGNQQESNYSQPISTAGNVPYYDSTSAPLLYSGLTPIVEDEEKRKKALYGY